MCASSRITQRKVTYICAELNPKIREKLVHFLIRRRSTFVWSHADMKGIDLSNFTHNLNVDLNDPDPVEKVKVLQGEESDNR